MQRLHTYIHTYIHACTQAQLHIASEAVDAEAGPKGSGPASHSDKDMQHLRAQLQGELETEEDESESVSGITGQGTRSAISMYTDSGPPVDFVRDVSGMPVDEDALRKDAEKIWYAQQQQKANELRAQMEADAMQSQRVPSGGHMPGSRRSEMDSTDADESGQSRPFREGSGVDETMQAGYMDDDVQLGECTCVCVCVYIYIYIYIYI